MAKIANIYSVTKAYINLLIITIIVLLPVSKHNSTSMMTTAKLPQLQTWQNNNGPPL